jgi:3D (Asp-Asp-Asp) domain-containing protein
LKKVSLLAAVFLISLLFTSVASASVDYPVKFGMRGDKVQAVQTMLSEKGFYSGAIDGIFGKYTLEAVKEFQRSQGLVADGIVGYDTYQYLSRPGAEPSRSGKALSVIATAYTAYDDGTTGYTYRGNKLHKGLVAVDPSVIPLGTRLYIPGYGHAIADDIGGAIKGNKIDLAFESRSEALQFGRQRITIYILE